MLTVIYFVLVQPLDNNDRGILDIYQEHSWRYNLTFYTDNPPYLDQNQDHSHFIIKHLLYQQSGLSSWISHLSASAQGKHKHLKKKIPPLFCSRWLRNSGQKCWELKLERTGTWAEEMFWVMADVGDMAPCYPTLLIGWKHFIFDNIGPVQALSRQPTHEDNLAFCLILHL